jgi:PadR family transcriptional regulator, regulatory protein PadR
MSRIINTARSVEPPSPPEEGRTPQIGRRPKVGAVVLAIYNALLQDGELYGGQLVSRSGFPTGSVYPALARLKAAGVVKVQEGVATEVDGRALRRKTYSLTDEGRSWARNELQRLGFGVPALNPSPRDPLSRDSEPSGESSVPDLSRSELIYAGRRHAG